MKVTNCQTEFWSLARWALEAGLISDWEIKAITRPQTRKHIYWCNHLRNLQGMIEYHKKERNSRLGSP